MLKSRRYVNRCHDKHRCTADQTRSKWPKTQTSAGKFLASIFGNVQGIFSSITFVALCGWAAKADDSIVCFGAKPDKGFLDMKSRRIRKWEGDAREAVDGGPGRGSWRRDPAEGSWRLDSREANSRGWRGSTDRGSQHQTPEQRGEAAWDRVQREWVKMSLIPVALWNFR